MFFDDVVLHTKKQVLLREPPPFLDTGWRPPQCFPNLANAVVIAFDVETYDPELTQRGPGWPWKGGHIVGFSIAARDHAGNQGKWYFPVRHELETEYNLDPTNAFAWLKSILETDMPKVGQNLIYDMGWLSTENIYVRGPLFDTSFAEALIDEAAEVNLDALAHKYLGVGKTTDALYAWLARCYGGTAGQTQRANIYRCSPRLVGPYGEDDADQPLRVLDHQWPIMHREGTLGVFRMECDGIPMLLRMRADGMLIDLTKAEQLYSEFGGQVREMYGRLCAMTGRNIDSVASAAQLAPALDAAGIQYAHTESGAPSLRKEWLKEQHHELTDLIVDIRELEKFCGTFIQGYLLEGCRPAGAGYGRIHCQLHPLRSDNNGAKTGRYSSSDPNLQNIPSRSKMGKRIRQAFVHEREHFTLEKIDYSQIEYRMLAHFACPSSRVRSVWEAEQRACDELRRRYTEDPTTDYHNTVYSWIAPLLGYEYPDADKERYERRRKPIKNINFGLLYGQSQAALAFKAGLSHTQATNFFDAYHKAAPYVRSTMRAIAEEVQDNGYITTILGRRCRFQLWEPAGKFDRKNIMPLPKLDAIAKWGYEIKRAGDYRGTNYKFQGSGTGDIIKASMVRAHKEGLFDVIGYPKLQVHDELVFSVIDDGVRQREAYRYLHHILETTTTCRVPIRIDVARGANWGSVH